MVKCKIPVSAKDGESRDRERKKKGKSKAGFLKESAMLECDFATVKGRSHHTWCWAVPCLKKIKHNGYKRGVRCSTATMWPPLSNSLCLTFFKGKSTLGIVWCDSP